jgi:hypothetical protein
MFVTKKKTQTFSESTGANTTRQLDLGPRDVVDRRHWRRVDEPWRRRSVRSN